MCNWLWLGGASRFNIIQLGIWIDLEIRKERNREGKSLLLKRTLAVTKKKRRKKNNLHANQSLSSLSLFTLFFDTFAFHARRHSCTQQSLYTHLGRQKETEGVWGERLRQRRETYPPVRSMRQLYVTEHEMKADYTATRLRPSPPNGPYNGPASHLQSDLKN